jgi:hypothetical protein
MKSVDDTAVKQAASSAISGAQYVALCETHSLAQAEGTRQKAKGQNVMLHRDRTEAGAHLRLKTTS